MTSPTADHTVVLHVKPGEVLDERWRLEGRVGQGAMGSVFRGRDLKNGTPVAVKVLAPEHCRKPKVLARFERETGLLVQLKHPNIVQLLGHGRLRALPYIVMEYLEGMTLAEVLEAMGGKMPIAETIALIKPITAGLSFLHRNRLIHRDVKPQNIFLTRKGRVAILDLGVVRDEDNPGLTKPGAMVGTPYYMSPEQIAGLEVDRRTDVYALAAMTFELLTGRPPFLGTNNFEVLYGHKNGAVPDAASLVPGLSHKVAAVISEGLAKHRNDRPETTSEFAAELEDAAQAPAVDFAVSFPFLIERERDARSSNHGHHQRFGVAGVHTRVVRQPQAPDASPADELSSEESSDSTPATGNTVVFSTDATFVGAVTEERNSGPTRVVARPVRTGQVRIAATFKKRAVMANFTIGGTKGLTPKVVALPPGRYTLKAELSGARVLEQKVSVVAGTLISIRLEFK